jgi:hypothetical protein
MAMLTIVKPLIVTSEQVRTDGRTITGLTLSFSKPLDPARAQDLGNYGYFILSSGPDGAFGSHDDRSIPIRSAVYDAPSLSATLTPNVPLAPNRFYRITLEGLATPLLNNGLTDRFANQLAGSGGVPGTPFIVTFAASTRLAYADGAGNIVTLQLKRGGLIELFRSPDGRVEQLTLLGAVSGRSILTGSVRRRHGGAGRISLPAIGGAAGVRIRLRTPFVMPQVPVAPNAARAQPAARTAAPGERRRIP